MSIFYRCFFCFNEGDDSICDNCDGLKNLLIRPPGGYARIGVDWGHPKGDQTINWHVCSRCQAAVDQGDRFCRRCGARFTDKEF